VDRLDFINAPMIDIASRWLRASMRDGHSVRFQVPDPVIDYADTQQLYR
jgi:nicotinic acid mononucleotide adenylyltransferase